MLACAAVLALSNGRVKSRSSGGWWNMPYVGPAKAVPPAKRACFGLRVPARRRRRYAACRSPYIPPLRELPDERTDDLGDHDDDDPQGLIGSDGAILLLRNPRNLNDLDDPKRNGGHPNSKEHDWD